jgi:hypothetical protein
MRADHPTTPGRKPTVSSPERARSRAALTALALVVLAPLALVGAGVAVSVTAATGPIGAGIAALALFTAPVAVPYLAVRGVTAAIERSQA